MDSHHNTSTYSINTNKDNELYDNYVRTPCAQQSQPPQNQHFSSYAMPLAVPNNMPQQLMYNAQNQPIYNIMYGSQSIYRNQNTFPVTTSLNSYTQSVDPIPWVSESCITNSELSAKDKYVKYDNKTKESNSSCFGGRIENIACPPLSGVYKTVNKNYYYNKNSIMDSHWFYSANYDSEKYSELPSCSQIMPNSTVNNQCCDLKDSIKTIKSVKYCSIQKYSDTDSKLFMYNSNNDMFMNEQYNKMTKGYSNCSELTNTIQSCNLYNNSSVYLENDKKKMLNERTTPVCDIIQSHHASCFAAVNDIGCRAETESNGGGESDIVVEDSEDEVSDDSDEVEKEESHICFICNTTATDANQLYTLTGDSPLTTYSQLPVYEKLTNILGIDGNISNHLCNTCLNLVNTADHLQIQLNTVKQELVSKYKSTLETFKLYVNKRAFNSSIQPIKKLRPKKRKFKSRDVCGIHSFKCSVCEKIFSLKKFYVFHMAKHKIKTKYLCEHCGCNFVKHSNLLAHLRKHTNCINSTKTKVQLKTYVCHICGKLFKSKTNLKAHEYYCSGNLPYDCNLCKKKFPSPAKLKQHIQLKHDKTFSTSCPTCGRGFVKNSDLKAHLLSHSSVKKFRCSKCEKTYKTLSNLNYHLKSHDDKLPYTCTLCSKGFLRKENLQTHMNLHSGLKPFDCSICNKKFASQKNLDAHLKIHNGTAKQKSCPICGKQISHGLEDHVRTHSTVKDLECVVCSMKFLTKGALAKHRKRKHDNVDDNVDVL